jgi:tRNA threonylcarbamoyl adenosine modification protein (Sua5/YciO/YrdC/YwlC family)
MTRILKYSVEQSLEDAANHLKRGGLVAFPTETVYGLGADARSPKAVRSIYEVKRRPATDPLIVHVPSVAFAEEMIHPTQTTPWQRKTLRALAEAFWPGPLTMILPAHPNNIAFEVTSGTGLVGLRLPEHPLAQKFLDLCQLPVAAPSANLFGHVSPTTAEHVLVDFPDVDNLWILDGGQCGFGIESTVVRLNENESLEILRRGGVGPKQLAEVLLQSGLCKSGSGAVRVLERFVAESSTAAQAAPGQLLIHYAPRIPAHMVSLGSPSEKIAFHKSVSDEELKQTVVLDFGTQLNALCERVGFYRNLALNGDSKLAAYSLFEALRWAEKCVPESGQVWIFDPRVVSHQNDELLLALQDRVVRATSGRSSVLYVTPDSGPIYVSTR